MLSSQAGPPRRRRRDQGEGRDPPLEAARRGLGAEGGRRLGGGDDEGGALLGVEVDRFGVVVAVADREVLAGLEEEVAPAEAEDDAAADAGRPDDRAVEDLRQVVEQRVTTM